jgi:hypothetical protein
MCTRIVSIIVAIIAPCIPLGDDSSDWVICERRENTRVLYESQHRAFSVSFLEAIRIKHRHCETDETPQRPLDWCQQTLIHCSIYHLEMFFRKFKAKDKEGRIKLDKPWTLSYKVIRSKKIGNEGQRVIMKFCRILVVNLFSDCGNSNLIWDSNIAPRV